MLNLTGGKEEGSCSSCSAVGYRGHVNMPGGCRVTAPVGRPRGARGSELEYDDEREPPEPPPEEADPREARVRLQWFHGAEE